MNAQDEMLEITLVLKRNGVLVSRIRHNAEVDPRILSTLAVGVLQRLIVLYTKKEEFTK